MERYSFQNVEFTYPEGEKKALRDIFFSIRQGEFVILRASFMPFWAATVPVNPPR